MKWKNVADMSIDELNAEREKRLASYIEVVAELNARQDPNGWHNSVPPGPDTPASSPVSASATESREDTMESSSLERTQPVTRAEKRAIMREKKVARKAQRRETRKILRKAA